MTIKKLTTGQWVITANVLERIAAADLAAITKRFMAGDFGELDDHDAELNEIAVHFGGQIFAEYQCDLYPIRGGQTVWIIRDADEKTTTVLLPEDY